MDKKQQQPKPETKQKLRRKRETLDGPWSSREVQVDDGMWHGPNPRTHDWKPEYAEPVEE